VHRLWQLFRSTTLIGGANGIALLMLAGPLGGQMQPGAQAPPPSVTVAHPALKSLATFDEYTGRFEANHRVELRSRVSGLIIAQHFKDGQIVAKGDLLFTIDKRPFEVELEAAKAEVQRQTALVEFAREDFERAQSLVARGSGTRRDLEQKRSDFRQAEAGLAVARSSLAMNELSLSYTDITAPMAGRVGAAAVQSGNFVQGGEAGGTALVSIASLDPIRFVFQASEANYLRYMRLAQSGERPSGRDVAHPVSLRLADETRFERHGRLEFVDNTLEFAAGQIVARALFDNPGGTITPGLFGRVRLSSSAEKPTLLVPDAAIVSDQQRRLVYVVDEKGVVAARLITLGPLHEGLRIVSGDLQVSDRIIVSGLQRARPGQTVKPMEEPKTVSATSVNLAQPR
jgi:RND family efflux transporter MFP subunit